MKLLRATLLGAALTLPAASFAQWQWIDNSGHKVFSDQSPPADIPAKNILKQPGARIQPPRTTAPETTAAASAQPKPAAPKLTGKDKELEEKKKRADAAEAEKKKAQEEQVAKEREENCARLKGARATIASGVRLTRVNEKGEREFLDDAQRATEAKRLDTAIARDCVAPS